MGVVTVFGGPLDGAELQLSRRAPIVWIDEARPHRVSLLRAPGRLLHTLSSGRAVYAEHTHVLCNGCGALHQRAEACQLCGSPLPRR